MKDFFNVDYSDLSEDYSVKFKIDNIYLDISIQDYDLKKAIYKFINKFETEYKYWTNIKDEHLNKKSLEKKNRFKEFNYAFEKCQRWNI
jgi:hypothetical protein